jgi:hypothetical protein
MFVDPRSVKMLNRKHGARYQAEDHDPREVQLLREIMQGPAEDGDRVRAMNAYMERGEADAVRLLTENLHDEGQSVVVRAGAAACLGRAGSLAEPLLLQALEKALPGGVQTKVIKALGRVAGAASIPALQRIAATSEEDIRSQAAFSLQLAAHRCGSRELVHCPREVEVLPPLDLRPVVVRKVGADYVQSVVHQLGTDSYGIELAREPSVDFECRGSHQTLLLNAQSRAFGMSRGALQRPMIFGLLAARSREDGRRFVSRVILVGPVSDDRFYVAVHRTDGRLMHSGTGTVRGEMADVSLQSVNTLGNFPLLVRVRITEQVVWDVIQAGRHIVESRTPDAFSPNDGHDPTTDLMTAQQAGSAGYVTRTEGH